MHAHPNPTSPEAAEKDPCLVQSNASITMIHGNYNSNSLTLCELHTVFRVKFNLPFPRTPLLDLTRTASSGFEFICCIASRTLPFPGLQ